MGRIGRSFALVGQSYRVLMQDKELMLLPLLGGAAIGAALAGAFFGFGLTEGRLRDADPVALAGAFVLYLATYAIGIFFQAAVVAGATERLRGGDPTVASALAAAWRAVGAIVAWAVLAATVGLVLRLIQERVGFVGRLLVGMLGVAWSLGTFFVVPVLVLEAAPVAASIRRSTGLFTRTWGETFAGGITVGVAAFCAWVTLVALVGLLAWVGAGWLALAAGAAGVIFLVVFFSAIQGVFVASLYRFATTNDASGFDAALLRQAFQPKRG